MMDAGDLVQNGLEDHSPTMDSENKEAEFKVIAPSVAAEDEKNDDGDFQGSVWVPFNLVFTPFFNLHAELQLV